MSIADGRKIAIKFTQPLIGNVLGLDPPVGYKKSLLDLSGAVVTTLNQYSTSYTGAKAIDNNTSTYWRGTTAVNWLKLQLPEAKCVTQIRLYLGSYYIKTFTFSGSNDGETWVQLGGTYTAASSTTAKWYTFTIENEEAYLYYKIDTLTAYSTSRIYLYEFDLYEDVPVGNETKFTVSFDEYNYVPGGTASRKTRIPIGMENSIAFNAQLNFDQTRRESVIMRDGNLVLDAAVLDGFAGCKIFVDKNFNDTMVHLTAIIQADADVKQGSVVQASLSGVEASNMYSTSNKGGNVFCDDTGNVGNGAFVESLTDVPIHTQVLSNENISVTVADQILISSPSSPYIKVPIIISGTAPYSFRLTDISVVINGIKREILDLGAFFGPDKEIIRVVNDNYARNGSAELQLPPIPGVSHVKSSFLSWIADTPIDTEFRVYAKLENSEYSLCENNAALPMVNAGMNLSSETIFFKFDLSTVDPRKTPALIEARLSIEDRLDDNTIILTFAPGCTNSIQRAIGDITVAYDGSGSLMGQGGPVLAFEKTFTPIGLDPKNNPHETEHLAIASAKATGTLTRVYYSSYYGTEHLDVSQVTAEGVLTHVDDI